jgi:hypothetical protein
MHRSGHFLADLTYRRVVRAVIAITVDAFLDVLSTDVVPTGGTADAVCWADCPVTDRTLRQVCLTVAVITAVAGPYVLFAVLCSVVSAECDVGRAPELTARLTLDRAVDTSHILTRATTVVMGLTVCRLARSADAEVLRAVFGASVPTGSHVGITAELAAAMALYTAKCTR